MAAIITEKFRIHNAKQFREDFSESASSQYIFIGRAHPWTVDTSPPTPVNGTSEEVDAWSDMTALKKVGTADVSHGLKRIDWTTGTKYDEYQHDYSSSNTTTGTNKTSLYDADALPYVMTDEYHVYKCIRTGRNSSGAVVNSTVKPTGTSATALVETSDTGAASGRGYLWKYMYTVTASDTIKFVTSDFIPVKTLGVSQSVDGQLAALGATIADDGSSQWDVSSGINAEYLNNAVQPGLGESLSDADRTAFEESILTIAKEVPSKALLLAQQLNSVNSTRSGELLTLIYADRLTDGLLNYGVVAVEAGECNGKKQAILHVATVTDPAKRMVILQDVTGPIRASKPKLKKCESAEWPISITSEPIANTELDDLVNTIQSKYEADGYKVKVATEATIALD